MARDVFYRFYNSLADHFDAFIKGIYISLPQGVSSQRLKYDLCWRFRDTFQEIIAYDPYHGLWRICSAKDDPKGGNVEFSKKEKIDLLTLLQRLGQELAGSSQRLLVLLDGVDSHLNEELVSLKLAEILTRNSFGYTLTFIGFRDFPRYDPLARLNLHHIPYPSPCRRSLGKMVRSGLEAIVQDGETSLDLQEIEEQVADSLFGCPSMALAEDLFNLAYAEEEKFDPARINKMKLSKIKASIPGISISSPLELPSMEQVIGFSHLKSYCMKRRQIFLKKESPLRLHGICLLGPPGTGKTLFAQALAHNWQIPYCNLRMTFLSKFVGASERNLETILRMLIDFGGPVLFHIDELSRLFGAVGADSHEVTKRIVAMLLNFLESPETGHIYTVGTTNSLDIDAALLRRFDDVFYVNLPDATQRRELFEFFAGKYGINLPGDRAVSTISRGMVGSDIERLVKELKIEAMHKGTEPSALELVRQLRNRPALAALFADLQRVEKMALQAGFRLASPRSKELSEPELKKRK
ncbi:MAG: ATP-binding protein [Deltaproteobacteria bacterium]|nr:ATP-binding protein [Deltaproteobacteria bacterium]MBW2072893.1 ATP-binding protein [Deltaproteobacteria bacterium]